MADVHCVSAPPLPIKSEPGTSSAGAGVSLGGELEVVGIASEGSGAAYAYLKSATLLYASNAAE